jgi:queuine/archaeosine tRNA-ribosyltransferase
MAGMRAAIDSQTFEAFKQDFASKRCGLNQEV